MKRILLLLALGTFLISPGFAQTNTTAPLPPPPGGRMGGLTPEERQELNTARKSAMEANPDLAAEQKALQDKINAAMIKADPNVAPIIAKLEAAHQHRDGDGGPTPARN